VDVQAEEAVVQTRVRAVETRANAELFFEDRGPSAASAKQRWKNRVLRSDLLWQQADAEAAALKEAMTPTMELRQLFREYPVAAALRAQRRKQPSTSPQQRQPPQVGQYDLWRDGPADVARPVVDTTGGWLSQVQPPKLRAAPPQCNAVPAVELPTDGESFRPERQAYEDMLMAEAAAAKREIEEVKKLERSAREINRKALVRRTKAQEQRVLEFLEHEGLAGDAAADDPASVQLPDMPTATAAREKAAEAEVAGVTPCSVEAAMAAAKQTRALQRLRALREARRLNKRRIKAQLEMLPEIAQEVADYTVAREQRAMLRKIDRCEQRARMTAVPPSVLALTAAGLPKALLLPSKLPRSMREMPNVAHPLRERFANLQRRNLVEVYKRRKSGKSSPYQRKAVRFVERGALRIPAGMDAADFIASL